MGDNADVQHRQPGTKMAAAWKGSWLRRRRLGCESGLLTHEHLGR